MYRIVVEPTQKKNKQTTTTTKQTMTVFVYFYFICRDTTFELNTTFLFHMDCFTELTEQDLKYSR